MNLLYAISTVNNGDMAVKQDQSNKAEVINNRLAFLSKLGIKMQDSTRVATTYDGNNYLRYFEINESNKGEGMFDSNVLIADALVTRQPGHALFLPLADCVGAAIFDPTNHILMLSHIGRHSLKQFGGKASVEFLVNNYGSKPEELLIWLTPAPGQENYPVFAFDNRSFKDVVFEQLQSAGVLIDNITDDPADTAKDPRYYSHSEFLAGRRDDDGRYAVVATMKD